MDEVRRHALRAGRVVFAVIVIGVLALAAARNASALRHVDLHPRPLWLLAAAPFTFAGGVLLPLAWRQTLAAYDVSLPPATAVRVWCVSQASRFIPGNVALVASRVVLAAREGVSRRLAALSLAIEVGLVVTCGVLFASWLPSERLAGPWRALLAVGAIGALGGVPVVLRRPRLYEAEPLYALNNLATAMGSALVAASLQSIAARDVILVIAAVNAGAVVGMIGITPAGLGVREGIVTVCLTPRFGAGNAAAMAVAFRAWDFAFELVWIGIAHLWERSSAATGKDERATARPPGSPAPMGASEASGAQPQE